MPHNRHARGRGQRDVEVENGNGNGHQPQHMGPENGQAGNHGGHQHDLRNGNAEPEEVPCCCPTGCDVDEAIHTTDPEDAVRVFCNNDQCTMGNWMHKSCFDAWEDTVLAYLKSCGRARSWSEKQRLQNLWTKKGYDLAFKACDCKCGKGHLRKDLDYIPKFKPVDNKRKQKQKKKPERTTTAPPAKPVPNHNIQNHNHNLNHIHHSGPRQALRLRTNSISSTGSSPPNSASPPHSATPPPIVNNNNTVKKVNRFDFFATPSQAATGNIFRRRTDFLAFSKLPKHQRNPYHIKMEDEGPHGNDEIRCFILSQLSTYKITRVHCCLCNHDMFVFDRYPLIDGTFFLTPIQYNGGIRIEFEGKMQYLSSVCMTCLEGGCELRCSVCRKRWNGSTLTLGTMYSYDIFAAMPCCQRRLSCKTCHRNILDASCGGLQFYSQYSQSISCPHCKVEDYHFIKPLNECFDLKLPIGA